MPNGWRSSSPPPDQVNARRLSEQEYRTLGDILRKAVEDRQYETTAEIIRVIALTGCRRSEVIGLRCGDSKEGRQCVRSACLFWNP
jgi:integrase